MTARLRTACNNVSVMCCNVDISVFPNVSFMNENQSYTVLFVSYFLPTEVKMFGHFGTDIHKSSAGSIIIYFAYAPSKIKIDIFHF